MDKKIHKAGQKETFILSILIYADQQYQNTIGKSKDAFDVDKAFNELKLETRLKKPDIINRVIEQDQLGLLPKSMHNQAIEILSKQLLEN